MKSQRGRLIKTSNFLNDAFLYVNNCGFYEDYPVLLSTDRPQGRVDYQLIFSAKGEVHILLEEETLILPQNSFFIFAPNTPQKYYFAEGSLHDFYWIHFSGVYIQTLLKQCRLETNKAYQGNNASSFIIKNTIKQISGELRTKNLNCEHIVASMLYNLLARLPRYLKNDDNAYERIADIVEIFNRNFTSINNTTIYAKQCGLSPTHFIRLFKKCIGITPKQYILKLRMEKAQHLLTTTDMKIHEIATECGFETPLYFSRLFHQYYGVPPTQF